MKMLASFGMIRQTLANRNYRLYLIGNFTSNLGLWSQRVAVGWVAWELTHSAAWLGGIALAESAPTIFLGLIAGTVTDRMEQLRLVRLTQALTLLYSVLLALFAFTGLLDIWLLTGLMIFRGSVVAFNRPSRMSFVYLMVGRELLPTAISTNAVIFNSCRFIGPAIGGALLATSDAAWALAASAAMFFVFTLTLWATDLEAAPPAPGLVHTSLWAETVEGLRYILRHPGIRLQLSLLVITGLFAKPITDLFPGFAGEIFDRGATGLAWLLTMHGVGATLGGIWMSVRGGLAGLTRITLANVLLMSVALLAFTATGSFWVACLLAVVIGFGFIVMGVSNQTLIQSAVDSSFRGRVLSVYGMVAQGVPSLGAMAMGAAAEQWGLRLPVAAGAALCLLLGIVAWRSRVSMAKSLEGSAV